MKFKTLADVRRANKASGRYWFTRGAMGFFRSRVETGLLGGRLFITSEQFDENAPRLYTVRMVTPAGHIKTVGEFQEYESLKAAKKELVRLLRMGEPYPREAE